MDLSRPSRHQTTARAIQKMPVLVVRAVPQVVVSAMMGPILCSAAAPLAKPVTISGLNGEVKITCRREFTHDYVAETRSGVPLKGSYAVERGADRGLVHLMDADRRAVRHFIIPSQRIQLAVRVAYAGPVPNRLDLVFSRTHTWAVRTYTTNGGIFEVSDVYRLPRDPAGVVRSTVKGDPELSAMIQAGMEARSGRCGSR